jgi:hypothetical protein
MGRMGRMGRMRREGKGRKGGREGFLSLPVPVFVTFPLLLEHFRLRIQ